MASQYQEEIGLLIVVNRWKLAANSVGTAKVIFAAFLSKLSHQHFWHSQQSATAFC